MKAPGARTLPRMTGLRRTGITNIFNLIITCLSLLLRGPPDRVVFGPLWGLAPDAVDRLTVRTYLG